MPAEAENQDRKQCPACGRYYPRLVDFIDVTHGGKSLGKVCRKCFDEGGPTASARLKRIDEINSAEAVRKMAKNRPADARPERVYQRKQAEFTMRFQKVRDRTMHEAQVKDISQSGLRFITDEELSPEMLVNVMITSDEPDINLFCVVRVVRVDKLLHAYEVGAKFVSKDGILSLKDRRVHSRHRADFEFNYLRHGRTRTNFARVRDISRGGVRFVTDVKHKKDEVIEIRIGRSNESVASFGLQAMARVIAISGGEGRIEARAQFVKILKEDTKR